MRPDEQEWFWAHLDDYLGGTDASSDGARMRALLASHPALQHYVAEIAECTGQIALSEPDFSDLRRRISTAAEEQRGSQSDTEDSRRRRAIEKTPLSSLAVPRSSHARLWSAAVLAVVGGIIAQQTLRTPARANAHVYSTLPGQRGTVRFLDGSQVVLAPTTSVTVSGSDVTVSGEAYFTVAPHDGRPLVVQTRNAIVQVLGTRFSVRQYPNESASRVLVEDGKVSVHAGQSTRRSAKHAVLAANTLAFATDSTLTLTPGVTTQDYTSWTRDELVFRQATLRDVFAELGRAYGSDITIADSLVATLPVTITVRVRHEPLTDVLHEIGLATKTEYRQFGQTFIVSRAAAPARRPQSNPFPELEKQYGR